MGRAACIPRNSSTNLPLDSGVVARNVPNPDPNAQVLYTSIKYYWPVRFGEPGIYGFQWYPWPAIRSTPRPVRDWEVPSVFYPLSSDVCLEYANRSRSTRVCPSYSPPPPRDRLAEAVERDDRPRLSSLLTCYDYLTTHFGRPREVAPPSAFGYAAPYPPTTASYTTPPPYSAAPTSPSSAAPSAAPGAPASTADRSSTNPYSYRRSLHGAPEDRRHGSQAPEGQPAAGAAAAVPPSEGHPPRHPPGRGEAGGGSEELLQTEYVPLLQTEYVPLARPASELRDAPPQGSGLGREYEYEDGYTRDWAREAEAVIGGYRRLQAVGAEREALLATPRELLTDPEQILLVPDWQRRLLSTADQGQDNAMSLLRARLRSIYGGSLCNATDGCDLRFGNCLNVSRLPVYEYDQNGTCACHHWFFGDD